MLLVCAIIYNYQILKLEDSSHEAKRSAYIQDIERQGKEVIPESRANYTLLDYRPWIQISNPLTVPSLFWKIST